MNYWKQSEQNIYVAAHRGWSSEYPENTMEAFRAALDAGVDQIETDVRITKDGELVLIHDATVDRTTNATGKVCDYTLAELKALDAGNGTKIPTFLELLELVKDHPTMTLDIELKEYPVPGWEEVSYQVCDRVVKLLDQYGYTERSVLNTFSGKLHEYIQKTYPERRRHVFFPLERMTDEEKHGRCIGDPYEGAYCCCMPKTFIKEEYDAMREKGIQPWAGASVKDAETVDAAIRCGAVLITCNNMGEVLDLLRERGYHQ